MTQFKVNRPRTVGVSTTRMGPYFTVASVELGNTTTKCIISTTNLQTAEIFQIAKSVRLTRDIRLPRDGEVVFGETLVGVQLTRESVTEMISDILLSTISTAKLDIEKDLHFVVRSTGVTAGFSNPDEVGILVQALADGCINAGIPPRKMTAAISIDSLPPGIRDYSWLKRVYFDGAVASSVPPSDASVVANEMEGELITAGIKGAAKSTTIDFRNPVMTIDFGTTLAGRVTDDSFPYSKTIGSFAGLAGAIPDALARGSGLFDITAGSALDIPITKISRIEIDSKLMSEAFDLITVETIPEGTTRFGTVPVDTHAAKEADVVIIGIDVGLNGSELTSLENLGKTVTAEYGVSGLMVLIDMVQAELVQQLVSSSESNGLVLTETSLGLTGRAVTTGKKPRIISENLRLADGSLWTSSHQMLFVEDGLALGAAVAARCMNSLGTPHNPMGGRKGDRCIMGARMKKQKKQ
ncbi:MAG: methanogenesis marker 14 protein [Candidatus Thorarchaeota archaeon]